MTIKPTSVKFKQPRKGDVLRITILSKTGETITISGIEQQMTFETIRDALFATPLFGDSDVRDFQ